MKDNRLEDYLAHMREAARDAVGFVQGMTRQDFQQDKRTQQAVVMSLVILGEAATQLMDRHGAFCEARPQIPWRNMRGMRNRIAHGYFSIDFDVVWDTVSQALPQLLDELERLRGDTDLPPSSSSSAL